ncbi:MAG: winged helix-turn-helix transcriptional regulator [Thermoflexales bacterium]|nr:winged helix-turn-helix transcriptional regulator [Thermoflexales bacterium]
MAIDKGLNGESVSLSERELEILRLVAAGLSNKEIASRLFLSVNTVKVHLRNVFGKIGAQSRTEATMYAIKQGWVSVPEAPPSPLEGLFPFVSSASRVGPAVFAPPLPWAKRVALVVIVACAMGGMLATWPRAAPADSAQLCEFVSQAGCSVRPPSTDSESQWQARAQMSTPRGRMATAAVNGKLYAIGGDTLTGVTGEVEVYNPHTDDWSTAASKPLPAANVAAAVLEGRIYVPGGYTATGPTAVVEVYDPQLDAWSSDATPLPERVFAYALAVYRQKVYLFGGSNGQGYLATTYEYDPLTKRWTALAPMPTARGFAAAAVLGEAIYVVGGYDGQQDLMTCERYMPATNQWEPCVPLSIGRGGLGLIAVHDTLYAIGGGWNSYLAFGERYRPGEEVWGTFTTPRVGQWHHLAATVDASNIYALGGWNGQEYLSINLSYNPFPFKIYLPVQSSSEEN